MKDKFFSKSITFLVLGVCSLLILFYTNDSWVKLINKNTLQMNSISRVQANVTSASLWLEETLSGDTSSDINTDFFGNIKKSEALLNVLYEGGHNNQGLYLPAIADVSTKNKVKDLLSLFPNFQQVAQQRLQNKDVADVVNKLDQQFNHFYDEIINATHIINDDLIKDLEANINNKKNEYYLISIIWLLTIFIFIYLIEKLNKKQVALESSLSIERKKLENSLNERTAELCEVKLKAESAKSALDQHSLVSIADQAGNILYVNDKFVEISGYQESELIGKKHNLLNSNNQPKSYWRDMHQTVL